MLNIICDTIAQYDCRIRDYRQHKRLQSCVIRLKKGFKLNTWRMFEIHYYLHIIIIDSCTSAYATLRGVYIPKSNLYFHFHMLCKILMFSSCILDRYTKHVAVCLLLMLMNLSLFALYTPIYVSFLLLLVQVHVSYRNLQIHKAYSCALNLPHCLVLSFLCWLVVLVHSFLELVIALGQGS